MKKLSQKILLTFFTTIILNLCTFTPYAFGSSFNYSYIVNQAKKTYKTNGYDYRKYMQTYTPTGDYLNYSQKTYQMTRIQIDERGIPMVMYYNQYQYNPVTIAQMALTEYGKYIQTHSQESYNRFIQLADALVALQSQDGSLRYSFSYEIKHLHTTFNPGWVSAMAQGQALSVYSRAYYLTKDEKYLIAGNAALHFLITPKSKGGTLTTLSAIGKPYKPYLFLEEYVTTIDNYTLNGFMFTLFGLYDWSKVTTNANYGQQVAKDMFKKGIQSLLVVLPLYDLGGFTAYDLSHITWKQKPHVVPLYHAVHIYELNALYTITKEKALRYYTQKWASYVQ